MKKIVLLFSALLAVISFSYAKKVSFVVDMTGQTISSNGVHVAGKFQGWDPAATPLVSLGNNLYGVVVDINAGQLVEYKFINNNSWASGIENVPALCQLGTGNSGNGTTNDNRWIYIDSTKNDTTLILNKFSAEAPTGMYAVRFVVDLAKASSVASDGVFISGSLNSWTKSKMSNLNNANKLYEYIAILPAGAIQYKFRNGDGGWESDFTGTSCNDGGNRGYTVAASAALNKVCFNSCTACPSNPIPKYKVTFRVDMQNSDCNGGFDSVMVMGDVIPGSWSTGTTLTKSSGSMIYTAQITLDSGRAQYKFRSMKAGKDNWESGDNKMLNLTKDTVLAANCFNSNSACVPKPAMSKITFIADLSDETPAAHVYLMGDFTKVAWQGGAIEMKPLTGANIGLYSVTIDSICPATIAYKFMNGDVNSTSSEEKFADSTDRGCVLPNGVGGFNRTYTRPSAAAVTLNYKFSKCKNGKTPTGIFETNLAKSIRVYPNPANAYTIVEFNDNATSHDVVIVDMAGRTVRTYNNYKFNALRVERDELTNGVYFIKATNEKNMSAAVKLIIE